MDQSPRNMSHQFIYFTHGGRLEPTPEVLGELLNVFKGTSFMPTTVQEMFIREKLETRSQLHLVTVDKAWRIEFEPDKVRFVNNSISDKPADEFLQFSYNIKDYTSRLANLLDVRSNRMSYVAKRWLIDINDAKLQNLESKLMLLPKFHQDNPPTEWSTRSISRCEINLNDSPETINTVVDINRIKIKKVADTKAQETSAIEIGFDINTHQQNIKTRFSLNDSFCYLESLVPILSNLSDEILELINA